MKYNLIVDKTTGIVNTICSAAYSRPLKQTEVIHSVRIEHIRENQTAGSSKSRALGASNGVHKGLKIDYPNDFGRYEYIFDGGALIKSKARPTIDRTQEKLIADKIRAMAVKELIAEKTLPDDFVDKPR